MNLKKIRKKLVRVKEGIEQAIDIIEETNIIDNDMINDLKETRIIIGSNIHTIDIEEKKPSS
jgi:hypothetical protein